MISQHESYKLQVTSFNPEIGTIERIEKYFYCF